MKTFFKLASVTLFFLLFFLEVAKAQTANVDSVFHKVEIEASFPGGQDAWVKYITKKIEKNLNDFTTKDYGTCIVRFIVDTHGKISDVKAMTMEKSKLAKVTIKAIVKGPVWIPAQQNGKPVNAYRLQPVTLTAPGK